MKDKDTRANAITRPKAMTEENRSTEPIGAFSHIGMTVFRR